MVLPRGLQRVAGAMVGVLAEGGSASRSIPEGMGRTEAKAYTLVVAAERPTRAWWERADPLLGMVMARRAAGLMVGEVGTAVAGRAVETATVVAAMVRAVETVAVVMVAKVSMVLEMMEARAM